MITATRQPLPPIQVCSIFSYFYSPCNLTLWNHLILHSSKTIYVVTNIYLGLWNHLILHSSKTPYYAYNGNQNLWNHLILHSSKTLHAITIV